MLSNIKRPDPIGDSEKIAAEVHECSEDSAGYRPSSANNYPPFAKIRVSRDH